VTHLAQIASQLSPVPESVAQGYLKLGLAGATLLTIIFVCWMFLRWAAKQNKESRNQFSEQLQAERDDVKDERKTHLAVAEANKVGTEKLADAVMEQTGTFTAGLADQRKDFTGAMQALTKDQIELAHLRAENSAREKSGKDE